MSCFAEAKPLNSHFIVRLLFGRVLSEIIEAGDFRHKKICFSGLIWSLKNNNKAKG